MANYKRRVPRRKVKCTLCTPNRQGNSAEAIKAKYRISRKTKEIYDTDH